jgi:hypothetical protein
VRSVTLSSRAEQENREAIHLRSRGIANPSVLSTMPKGILTSKFAFSTFSAAMENDKAEEIVLSASPRTLRFKIFEDLFLELLRLVISNRLQPRGI